MCQRYLSTVLTVEPKSTLTKVEANTWRKKGRKKKRCCNRIHIKSTSLKMFTWNCPSFAWRKCASINVLFELKMTTEYRPVWVFLYDVSACQRQINISSFARLPSAALRAHESDTRPLLMNSSSTGSLKQPFRVDVIGSRWQTQRQKAFSSKWQNISSNRQTKTKTNNTWVHICFKHNELFPLRSM